MNLQGLKYRLNELWLAELDHGNVNGQIQRTPGGLPQNTVLVHAGFHNEPPQRHHQATFLSNLNKLGRRDNTKLLILPTYQGFQTNRFLRLIHLGLIHHVKRV